MIARFRPNDWWSKWFLANWSELKFFEDKNPSPVMLGGLLFCAKSVNSAIVYSKNEIVKLFKSFFSVKCLKWIKVVQNLNDSLANRSESKISSPVVIIILFMRKKCELCSSLV